MENHIAKLNSHAGLRPGELKQRFLKNRYAPCKEDVSWENEETVAEDDSLRCWNCKDEVCQYCRYVWHNDDTDADPEDYFHYKIKEYFFNGSIGPEAFAILKSDTEQDVDEQYLCAIPKDRVIDRLNDLKPSASTELEKMFLGYEKVEEFFNGLPSLNTQQKEVLRVNFLRETYTPLLILICVCKDFWVRPISTWNIPKIQKSNCREILESLLKHLFGKYSVPKFILNSLTDAEIWDNCRQTKWFTWMILWGHGVSLRRAAKICFFWENLSKKYIKCLHSLVDRKDLDAGDACLMAEIYRRGGNELDFHRIKNWLTNHMTVYNLYDELYSFFSMSSLADELLDWVIDHRDELTDESIELIFTWVWHMDIEMDRDRIHDFSIKNLSFKRAYSLAEEYDISRSLPHGNEKWQSHNWNWEYTDEEENKWQINELTSGKELYLEGKKMQHCVASYSETCAVGSCAIFSLKKNNKPVLTIEIDPKTRTVFQARGKCNRSATQEEDTIVSRWQAEIKNNTI